MSLTYYIIKGDEMVSEDLTVIVPIRQGQEDACRTVLEAINTPNGTQIDFSKSNLTHFARFVIVSDVDSGKGRKRLVFSAVYDGNRDSYLRDLQNNTSDMDAIWGHCEGYTNASNFVRFVNAYNNPTNLFLKGFRYETVSNIQKYLALREQLASQFDVPISQHQNIIKQLPRQFAPISLIKQLFRGVGTLLKYIFVTLSLIPQMIALLRYGLVLIDATRVMLSQVSLDREYSDVPLDKSGPCDQFSPGDEVVPCKENDSLLAFQERRMMQNQVTLITLFNPDIIRRQEAILNSLGTFLKVPFITRNRIIPTIHFGRWVMIDDGRRMMFLSDYDGDVGAYIADFVNLLPSGLNTLWYGTIGWRDNVTLDPEALIEGILCHNTPACFHYSAYPQTTLVGIENARRLYYAYHDNINAKSAQKWLKYL